MGIYIKNMTWEQFSNCCGEGADYLLGTGQANEILPHGRLIDAEEIKRNYQDNCDGVLCEECPLYFGGCKVEQMIDDVPTVIPADGE